MKLEKATFGCGCFWGVEEAFRTMPGVVSTVVGYMGGKIQSPTYAQVCTGLSGHAEVVQVEFDPKKVTYEQLLEVFWTTHDPTILNAQGPNIGPEYRSVIFYHSTQQKKSAEKSKANLEKSGKYGADVVTQIVPAKEFYRAEEFHQKFLQKRGAKTCHF